MRNRLTKLLVALALTSTANAQNPIIRNQFTADPTARVFNGRVYLFPSHDIPAPDDYARKDWFCMADYHMFTSNDLVDWTDNGVIVSQEQVPWGNPKGYSMWAPDCIQHNGKYYFYFPDGAKPQEGRRGGGFGIGVAIADNLFGRGGGQLFKVQEKPVAGIGGIDPCVLQASNGKNYIFWGMGGLQGAELGEDMMSIVEGTTVRFNNLPGEGLKEGPFAFEYNGNYYLTYPSVFKNGETEQLDYAMSKNPLGPYEYKGTIMQKHQSGCWTNHHSIIQFKDQWYLFYHHNDYSPKFDKNRSACIDSLFFNADGTIREVKATKRGVGISDARKPVQIDRYSNIGGGAYIEYHDTTNYFAGWKTVFPKTGSWLTYNKVDAKSSMAKNVCMKVKTKAPATMKLQLGKYVATLNIPSTQGIWKEINVATATVIPSGVQDLKLSVVKTTAPIEIDWLSLSENPRMVYFNRVQSQAAPAKPDQNGFIRRWMLLEPIVKPNRSNTIYTNSYLRSHFYKKYFDNQLSILPTDGQEVVAKPQDDNAIDGEQTLKWHAVESTLFNTKLFRFSSWLEKTEYGVMFWGVTVIDCPQEIKNVRLSAGSNGASMWWLDGKEILLLEGDRRMVQDDGNSSLLTLKKGRNVLRFAVLNGPGMSDLCARFVDEKGKPVTNFNITLK